MTLDVILAFSSEDISLVQRYRYRTSVPNHGQAVTNGSSAKLRVARSSVFEGPTARTIKCLDFCREPIHWADHFAPFAIISSYNTLPIMF
ncbi:MAG: hypothetical protein Q9212_001734 [Teloschistes hypoglaucus]